MALVPKKKKGLVPKKKGPTPKRTGSSLKPKKKTSSGLKPKKKTSGGLKPKKKATTQTPNNGRKKWDWMISEENVLLGSFDPPGIKVYFNTEIEHFFLRYVDRLGRETKLSNTFSPSFIKALITAYKRAQKKKLIVHGRAIAPPEEEE